MNHSDYNTQFRATVQPATLTVSEIAANVAALGYPDGATQDRFLALRKAAVGEGALSLTAQQALLEIVRARATKGGLS